MTKKSSKYSRIFLNIYSLALVVIAIYLKTTNQISANFILLFIGLFLIPYGIVGYITNSIMFSRGEPLEFDENSIWGKVINALICIIGIAFIILYFFDIL